jgi:hypothetical protein
MTQPDRRLLPRFENAPVIETVLGLEFAPLDKWTLVHFGIFWQEIRDEFPEFRVQPPLGSEIEDLDNASESQRQMRLQFVDQPDVRCWFLSADGNTNPSSEKPFYIQLEERRWRVPTLRRKYPSCLCQSMDNF